MTTNSNLLIVGGSYVAPPPPSNYKPLVLAHTVIETKVLFLLQHPALTLRSSVKGDDERIKSTLLMTSAA